MTIVSELNQDFNNILQYGEQVRFKYYNTFYTGEYDDDVTLIQSGTDFWCSGVVQPIDTLGGGYDSLLFQQGKVTVNDKKLYVIGTIQTSGLGPIKIGMNGSPTTREYEIISDGHNTQWELNGSPIYKKIYLRYLTNGSFIGE